MQAFRAVPCLLEALTQARGHVLRVAEDHHALVLVGIQQVEQVLVLLLLIGFDDVLRDIRLVVRLRLHNNLDGIVLVFPGDRQHVLIGRRAEHHQLTVWIGALDDLLHVLDEAHLEHLVRLVEHHRVHGGEPDVAALHVIKQPAGRRNQNLRLARERAHLLAERLAAVNHGDLRALDKVRQVRQLVGDLLGQLAGRRQHDFLHTGIIQIDIFEHRDPEAQRFAGSGRSNRDDVVAIHHQRNALLLNTGQLCKAHPVKGPDHLVADAHPDKRMLLLYLRCIAHSCILTVFVFTLPIVSHCTRCFKKKARRFRIFSAPHRQASAFRSMPAPA